MLRPRASLSNVERQLSAEIHSHLGEDFIQHNSWGVSFQRLTDIHLDSHLALEIEPNGTMKTLMIFLVIGFFVLLVGIVNFVSLSAARFSDRAMEIGIRKVVGADRKTLILQFIGEAVIVTFFSALIAISLAEILLPYFGLMTGRYLSMGYEALTVILCASVVVGVVAGSHPALILSSLQADNVLRGGTVLKRRGTAFRKGLVVTQFVVAIATMIATIIVARQLSYLEGRNPGFDKKDMVVIPLQRRGLDGKYAALKSRLDGTPGVVSVTGSMGEFGFAEFKNEIKYHGSVLFECRWLGVDYGFVKAMKIGMLSGRTFSRGFASDTAGAVLVNETAASKLAALGLLDKQLELGIYINRRPSMHVIGVTKDFNYLSMYNPVKPFFLILEPERPGYVYVRISPQHMKSTLENIGEVWKDVNRGYPFEYHFLDQQLDNSYSADQSLGRVFGIAAFLSIFISVIGIFGFHYCDWHGGLQGNENRRRKSC